MTRSVLAACGMAALLAGACSSKTAESINRSGSAAEATSAAISAGNTPAGVLDDFHDAASEADFDRYFGHTTLDFVFLGTDATERWERREFAAFCRPYFAAGKGWTYRPRDRHISFGAGPRVAWFDELLENDNYGTCRGSGVLVLGGDGVWRIAQYNLSMPVPNDLAREVVRMIREMPAKPAK